MKINSAAVIGTGFIGTVHVESIRRTGVPVKGVLAGNSESTKIGAKKLLVDKAYESLDQICEDKDVTVVHVTSPNALHYSQVKQLLNAGKHVVCEKPLALSAQEGRELVELAKKTGLIHATCFNTRFYPMVHEAKFLVNQELIGAPRYIKAHYHQQPKLVFINREIQGILDRLFDFVNDNAQNGRKCASCVDFEACNK